MFEGDGIAIISSLSFIVVNCNAIIILNRVIAIDIDIIILVVHTQATTRTTFK